MVAVVTTVEIWPEKMDEYLQVWSEEVLPLAKTFKGLVHAYVLLDRETCTAQPIFFYQTTADADAVLAGGQFAVVAQKLGFALKPGTLKRSTFEVPIEVNP